MGTWEPGRSTIDHLLERGRLQTQASDHAEASGDGVLGRGELRLKTARGGLEAGDLDRAFVVSSDPYRMAAQ